MKTIRYYLTFLGTIKVPDDVKDEDIPSFIIDLGKAVSLSGPTFTEWIKRHTNDFQDLLKPYL